MSLPKYKDIKGTIEEIDQEIFILQKSLFDLKIKKSTKQDVKAHLFIHIRRRLAQFEFKKGQIKKELNLKQN